MQKILSCIQASTVLLNFVTAALKFTIALCIAWPLFFGGGIGGVAPDVNTDATRTQPIEHDAGGTSGKPIS